MPYVCRSLSPNVCVQFAAEKYVGRAGESSLFLSPRLVLVWPWLLDGPLLLHMLPAFLTSNPRFRRPRSLSGQTHYFTSPLLLLRSRPDPLLSRRRSWFEKNHEKNDAVLRRGTSTTWSHADEDLLGIKKNESAQTVVVCDTL